MEIEWAIRTRRWNIVVQYASESGRHRGKPPSVIKRELSAQLKTLKTFGFQGEELVEKVLEWLGL